MFSASAEYVAKTRETIRETTKFDVFFNNGLGMYGTVFPGYNYKPPLFDETLSSTVTKSFYNSGYYGTYANNGICIGDTSCCFYDSNNVDTDILGLTLTPTRTSDVELFNYYWFDMFSELGDRRVFSVGFLDYVPSKITISDGQHTHVYTNIKKNGCYVLPTEFASTVGKISIIANDVPLGYRIRMAYINFGATIVFNNDNVASLTYDDSLDLISAVLPQKKLELSVIDYDGLYDPANPKSVYNLMSYGSSVTVRFGYPEEMINYARLYLKDTPTYDNNILNLTFISGLEMKNEPFTLCGDDIGGDVGGRSVTYNSYDAIQGLDINVDTTKFGSCYNYAIVSTDKKSAVQIFANYLGAYIVTDDNGIMLKPTVELGTTAPVDFHLTGDLMRAKYPKLTMQPMVRNMLKTLNMYKISDSAIDYVFGNAVELTSRGSGLYGAYVYLPIEYSDVARVELTISDVDWRVYRDSYTRQIYIDLYSTAPKFVPASTTAKLYRTITDGTEIPPINSYNNMGEDLPINNPLNVLIPADSPRKFNPGVELIYKNRQIYEVEYSQDFRLQVGDVITIDTKYETDIPVVITDLKFSLPGRWGVLKCRRLK